MLQNFSSQAQIAFRALDAIDNVGNSPEPNAVQADLNQLLKQSIQEVKGIADSRQISIDCHCPPNQFVWVEPQNIHQALTSLMRHGVQSAASGTVFKLIQSSDATSISFHWTWKGAGLDSFFVGQAQLLWENTEDIPKHVKPYVEARRTFSDLHLMSKPGEGVQITFSLPRAAGGS